MDPGERHRLALAGLDRDRLRAGAQRADHDSAVVGVGAEDRMGFGMLATRERIELGLGDHQAGSSSRRTMPATGIGSQLGRLSSSYCSS